MLKTGIPIEVHHHEVATAGQCEIDMRYDTLVTTADNCLMYKYIVKNMAKKNNLVATFMPKPLFGDNGSGMHTHQSLWKGGQNIFFDPKGYGLLSQSAKYSVFMKKQEKKLPNWKRCFRSANHLFPINISKKYLL
jgi:glutamine synthetase